MGKSSGDPRRKARLQAVRKAFGLRQQDVADRGGIGLQTVTMLEGGYTEGLLIHRRELYAKGYGLTVAQFGDLLSGALTAKAAIAIIGATGTAGSVSDAA